MPSKTQNPLYELVLKLPAGTEDSLAGVLSSCFEDLAVAVSSVRENRHYQGAWEIHWLFEKKPPSAELQARFALMQTLAGTALEKPVLAKVPEINWLEHCYKQLPPLEIGRFFIHGSHYKDTAPDGMIGIEINAATAFGSGEHPTTAACLSLIESLSGKEIAPRNILDMGCGSGILAIAAIKLLDAPALAVDIDEESVAMTVEHAAKNNINRDRITCFRGNGFHEAEIRRRGPYDLILANILAGTLVEMADDLTSALAPGGVAILSGLLSEQREKVLAAYYGRGLVLEDIRTIKEWDALLLRCVP